MESNFEIIVVCYIRSVYYVLYIKLEILDHNLYTAYKVSWSKTERERERENRKLFIIIPMHT